MEIYYINHNNQKINFMNGCYDVEESSFFEHSWDYDSSEGDDYGGIIERFKKGVRNKKFVVHITSTGLIPCDQAYEDMIDILEKDVLQKKPGKLYVNGYYLECYIYSGKPKYFVPELGSISYEMEIVTEYEFWISEQSYTFDTNSVISTDNKRYSYKYAYRYANGLNNSYIINPHFTESNFKLIIYGPAVNPMVVIGENTYLVNIILEKNERLEIDSNAQTVIKILSNGEMVNAFHNRQKKKTFFQKIAPGRQSVSWTGKFPFDLIIYEERSEPKWN